MLLLCDALTPAQSLRSLYLSLDLTTSSCLFYSLLPPSPPQHHKPLYPLLCLDNYPEQRPPLHHQAADALHSHDPSSTVTASRTTRWAQVRLSSPELEWSSQAVESSDHKREIVFIQLSHERALGKIGTLGQLRLARQLDFHLSHRT